MNLRFPKTQSRFFALSAIKCSFVCISIFPKSKAIIFKTLHWWLYIVYINTVAAILVTKVLTSLWQEVSERIFSLVNV